MYINYSYIKHQCKVVDIYPLLYYSILKSLYSVYSAHSVGIVPFLVSILFLLYSIYCYTAYYLVYVLVACYMSTCDWYLQQQWHQVVETWCPLTGRKVVSCQITGSCLQLLWITVSQVCMSVPICSLCFNIDAQHRNTGGLSPESSDHRVKYKTKSSSATVVRLKWVSQCAEVHSVSFEILCGLWN